MNSDVDSIQFLKDLEVRDLDPLDLASLAHSLHQGVHLASLPFRIAMFGPWGSGKTTIMRRVQDLLDQATESGQKTQFGPAQVPIESESESELPYIRTLWFNPWERESGPSLVQSLVTVMGNMIPEGVRYSRKGNRVVKQALDTVRGITPRNDADGDELRSTLALEGELSEADRVYTLRHSFMRLLDLILSPARRGQSRRLVIFVDDLDKCAPHSALAFLESCKLFFSDQARVVFVFALDHTVLSSAISVKYTQGAGFNANRYIQKIFEFSYTVHPIQWQQLGRLVADLYERSRLGTRLNAEDRAEELAIIEHVLQRPGIVLNPRKVKRIFNKFIWFLTARDWLPKANVYPLQLWLSWLLISEYWSDFRALVGVFGTEVLGELCNRVTGNLLFPHSNELVRQSLETLPRYKSLLDYGRNLFDIGDMHGAETQTRLREMIVELVDIDRQLMSHGL